MDRRKSTSIRSPAVAENNCRKYICVCGYTYTLRVTYEGVPDNDRSPTMLLVVTLIHVSYRTLGSLHS